MNGLGAQAATLVVGDVLGELGDEIERVEDLEVACNVAEEVGAGGLREAPAGFFLGQVKDLALVGDTDHVLEAEGTSQHVMGNALDAGGVAFWRGLRRCER